MAPYSWLPDLYINVLRGMVVLETSWVAGLSYRANHEVNNCFETWPGKGRSFINEGLQMNGSVD